MAGRFVLIVDLTHDDQDGNSHMSDKTVAASSECKCFIWHFCIGTVLTSWGRFHAECSKSLSDTVSDRSKTLTIAVSLYVPSGFTSSSWTERLFNWVHNEHEKLWMFSAKRRDVLCFHQQGELLAAAHQHEAIARQNLLSALARSIEAHNCVMCRCKFDSSNWKHMRDFVKDRVNCYVDFLRTHTKPPKTSLKFWQWREQQKSGGVQTWVFQALHAEVVPQPQNHEYAWTTSALDRIGSRNTATSRDVWRNSNCSIGCWTRSWSTLRKRERKLTRSTTSIRTNLESHQPMHSEGEQLIHELCNCKKLWNQILPKYLSFKFWGLGWIAMRERLKAKKQRLSVQGG